MSKYVSVKSIDVFLHRPDWHTPDERWRPESEFGALVDSLSGIETDNIEAEIEKLQELFTEALLHMPYDPRNKNDVKLRKELTGNWNTVKTEILNEIKQPEDGR